MLVLGFLIMILGTYANLGAIDEQQSGQQSAANMPIDRLPDIHIVNPTEENHITAKLDDLKNKIEIGPKNQADAIYEKLGELKNAKQKMNKEKVAENNAIREIVLNEKESVAAAPNKSAEKLAIDESVRPSVNAKVAGLPAPAQKPVVVPSQMAEPTTVNKPSDSVINNEAIKKEDHEIEMEAKESKQNDAKLTKEILNQLSKQNEENQKLVLEKINEISKKVNSIASMHNSSNSNTMPHANEVQNASKVANNEPVNVLVMNDEKNQENQPQDPILKMLADQKPSAAPTPNLDVEQAKSDVIQKSDRDNIKPKTPEEIANEVPPKVEKNKENIGRDLLSNAKDLKDMKSKSVLIKSET